MERRRPKPMRRMAPADIQPPPRAKRPESLTLREQEILELIWAGFKNKEVGQRLKISVKTVETHRSQLMERLDIHDVAGLVRYAISVGLINVE